MTFILNPQRRALEGALSLTEKMKNNIVFGDGKRYFIGSKEIFLGGISDGVGSCADIQGVDVAVFFYDGPADFNGGRCCAAAAATVRNPTIKEAKRLRWLGDDLRVVEALEIESIDESCIKFRLTRRKRFYPPIR